MAASSVVGSLAIIILLAVINSLAKTGLTGGQVVLYGLIGGIATGVFAGYMLTYFIIRKTKKFILSRLTGALGRFGFLKRT